MPFYLAYLFVKRPNLETFFFKPQTKSPLPFQQKTPKTPQAEGLRDTRVKHSRRKQRTKTCPSSALQCLGLLRSSREESRGTTRKTDFVLYFFCVCCFGRQKIPPPPPKKKIKQEFIIWKKSWFCRDFRYSKATPKENFHDCSDYLRRVQVCQRSCLYTFCNGFLAIGSISESFSKKCSPVGSFISYFDTKKSKNTAWGGPQPSPRHAPLVVVLRNIQEDREAQMARATIFFFWALFSFVS